VEIDDCNDSGCAGDIAAPSWCDITEESGNECRCHVRGPFGEVFIADEQEKNLCWSLRDWIHARLSHWVRLSFIQEF
jgi:hypothetical protein